MIYQSSPPCHACTFYSSLVVCAQLQLIMGSALWQWLLHLRCSWLLGFEWNMFPNPRGTISTPIPGTHHLPPMDIFIPKADFFTSRKFKGPSCNSHLDIDLGHDYSAIVKYRSTVFLVDKTNTLSNKVDRINRIKDLTILATSAFGKGGKILPINIQKWLSVNLYMSLLHLLQLQHGITSHFHFPNYWLRVPKCSIHFVQSALFRPHIPTIWLYITWACTQSLWSQPPYFLAFHPPPVLNLSH